MAMFSALPLLFNTTINTEVPSMCRDAASFVYLGSGEWIARGALTAPVDTCAGRLVAGSGFLIELVHAALLDFESLPERYDCQ